MTVFRLGISPYTALRDEMSAVLDTLYYFHFFIQQEYRGRNKSFPTKKFVGGIFYEQSQQQGRHNYS